jgi:hypothetical protein
MIRKRHRKCVLRDGYAVVEEVGYTQYCFPKVLFYDFLGVYLGELGQLPTRHLYQEIKRTFYGNDKGVRNLDDRDIIDLRDTKDNHYRFVVSAGLIYLIDLSLGEQPGNRLLCIEGTKPIPLIQAIDLLA